MRCPNCGAENQEGAKFCKMCGRPFPTVSNGGTELQNWQDSAHYGDNYPPTMYIPEDQQPFTQKINTRRVDSYIDVPYRDVYQEEPGQNNNGNRALLLTVLFSVLAVVIAICAFLVLKFTVLDKIWKDPASDGMVASESGEMPYEPASEPEAAEPEVTEPSQQPGTGANGNYTQGSQPAKGENIISGFGTEKEQNGFTQEKESEPEPEPEKKEEKKEETTTDHYIIPYSDTQYLTESDLRGLSEWELKLARNEIYARHGRRFKDPALQEYFDAQSWYKGIYDPDDFDKNHNDELSNLEKKNAEFILQYELDHGYMT